MIKLNNEQKQFLFDNYYVNAKVLDACVEEGWQNYFIKNFDWVLEGKDRYGFEILTIVNKKSDFQYEVRLNFQGTDYKKLIKLI